MAERLSEFDWEEDDEDNQEYHEIAIELGYLESRPRDNHYRGERTVFTAEFVEGEVSGWKELTSVLKDKIPPVIDIFTPSSPASNTIPQVFLLSDHLDADDSFSVPLVKDDVYRERTLAFGLAEGASPMKTVEVGYPAEEVDGYKRVGVTLGREGGAAIMYDFDHPAIQHVRADYTFRGRLTGFEVIIEPIPDETVEEETEEGEEDWSDVEVHMEFDTKNRNLIQVTRRSDDMELEKIIKVGENIYIDGTAVLTPGVDKKTNEAWILIKNQNGAPEFDEELLFPRRLDIKKLYSILNSNKKLALYLPEPPIL